MSRTNSKYAKIVTEHVPDEENRYRWHILRYLRMCSYPAGLTELSEYIGPQVGIQPLIVRKTIHERDLPALAKCGSIKYDPDSKLACLSDDQRAFTDHVRRALAAGVISHLKPLRLARSVDRIRTEDNTISE